MSNVCQEDIERVETLSSQCSLTIIVTRAAYSRFDTLLHVSRGRGGISISRSSCKQNRAQILQDLFSKSGTYNRLKRKLLLLYVLLSTGLHDGVSKPRRKDGEVELSCLRQAQDAKEAASQMRAAYSAPQQSLGRDKHSESSESDVSSAPVPAGTAGTRLSGAPISPTAGMKSAERLSEESEHSTSRVQWSSPSLSAEPVGLTLNDSFKRPPPILTNRPSSASPSLLGAQSPSTKRVLDRFPDQQLVP